MWQKIINRINYLASDLKCVARTVCNMEETITGLQTQVNTVNLSTYADLQSYDFTTQSADFIVANDEDKNITNALYKWNGVTLLWIAGTENAFQPTI